MSTRRISCSIVLFLSLGCDDGSAAPPAPAKAADADELDAETKARLAERKAKREAEQKAKADAEAKLQGEIERLCIVPDDVPKDFVAACDAVGKAHDEYVRRSGDPEAIAEWDGGGSERHIPMTVVQCTQADSVEVAACQKHALDGLGPEMKDHIKDFLRACIDKYASKRPTAGVPKRRPG
jgi:hypothetical protein